MHQRVRCAISARQLNALPEEPPTLVLSSINANLPAGTVNAPAATRVRNVPAATRLGLPLSRRGIIPLIIRQVLCRLLWVCCWARCWRPAGAARGVRAPPRDRPTRPGRPLPPDGCFADPGLDAWSAGNVHERAARPRAPARFSQHPTGSSVVSRGLRSAWPCPTLARTGRRRPPDNVTCSMPDGCFRWMRPASG